LYKTRATGCHFILQTRPVAAPASAATTPGSSGDDEAYLLRPWREKRREIEPKDLSGNLIVQHSLAE
jgi:hypothetical protein